MLNLEYSTYPEFQTERLTLRTLKDSDEPVLFTLRNDERVNQYIDRAKNPTMEDVRAWMEKIRNNIDKRECFYWAITLQNTAGLIGTICLFNFSPEENSVEIGFELFPEYQGKGMMTEALDAVLKFSFGEIKAERIDAWVHKQNESSMRLVDKYNFLRNSELEEKLKELPELEFLSIYSLFRRSA